MKWQEQYKEKLRSADEVADMIKSGETICLAVMSQPRLVPQALCKRRDELENVTVIQPISTTDIDWYNPGYEKAFTVFTGFSGPYSRQALKEKRVQYMIYGGRPIQTVMTKMPPELRFIDWFIIPTSPPDSNGYVSLGPMLWFNRTFLSLAKRVVAEVNERLIRCFGSASYAHISELDYLVEATFPPTYWEVSRMMSDYERNCLEAVGSLVASLVNDGDCIEIGTGTLTSTLTPFLEDKHELGVHTELTVPGIVDLHRKGVITGSMKQFHPRKVVATAFILNEADQPYVELNPGWELYEMGYTNDPRNIALNDNVVAINQALLIDLTGQVAAEGIGHQMLAGAGGQNNFCIGASMSRGGRTITVLSSLDGQGRSRIVPALPSGTPVSVQRQFVELVVTEYGIADLRGLMFTTEKQRAELLISIAHPDHRAELRREVQRLYG